ncbi:26682_t:CDS:2 [Gigaspora margarita]|uniref:26682_t:CDS:1 n=1 Tax=Gigaspora margarita TaxID=4874 RepID=A0ABN7UIY7_GIGMA|nr:26682_t:CDS:2 [Gigaspora margarita]
MNPRHVKNNNHSEHEEDRNQTPVNPPLLPPGQNGNPNQEPLYIIASWLSVVEPRNLEEAVIGAHKIEAAGYYRERNEVQSQQGKIETDLTQLTHQMQTMSVNYDRILTALVARVETQESRPRNDNQRNGPNQTQPQNLNQAERKQVNEPIVQNLLQACNVNLCDLDDTGYYPEGEDAFVTPIARHQPYSTQRPQRNLKKSESKAKEKL